MNLYQIERLMLPVDGYTHIVKTLTSVDGGATFYYCGNSKYFRNEAEAAAYKAQLEREGRQYRFSCGNAFIDGRIISGFSGDDEAAAFAANYEAMCYRIGTDETETLIYSPAEVNA